MIVNRLRRILWRGGRSTRGQSVIEFTLALPILIIMLALIADVGRGFQLYTIVTNAAREGARYGTLYPSDASGIQLRVRNMKRFLPNREHGQSMVEFALVALLLIPFLFGIMESGRAVYDYTLITNAAREGARLATVYPTDTTAIKNRVISKAPSITLTTSNVTITYPDGSTARGNRVRIDVTYNFTAVVVRVFPSITLRASAAMMIE